MKIRPKLILAEIILSLTLFISLLYTITSLVNFIGVEDLMIKTVALQDTASRMKYTVIGMLIKSEPSSFLTLEYELLEDQMTQNLASIKEDRLFKRLSPDVRALFTAITDSWENTQRTFIVDEITSYLDLRNESTDDRIDSLLNLQAVLRESGDAPYTYMRNLDDAIVEISFQVESFNNFEKLIIQTLNNMLEAADRYRQKQIILAVAVPVVMLLLAILGILLFANTLSNKLIRFDEALSEVAGGDFSIRIDMKGRDEFNSLATSINAFTRTLGSKLESFRLIMHDIGQTLSTSIDSMQVESTLLKLAMRETIADGAALYKVGGESGELILSLSVGRFNPPFTVTDLPDAPAEEDIEAIIRSRIIQPGQTILGESAVQGQAVMIRDVQFSDEIDWSRPKEDPLYISSIIVVPLQIGSTVFGVIAITSSKPGSIFTDLEYANMQSFGELAAITLDNIYKYADLLEATQLDRELGIAEEIQQDLLPKRLPGLPGGDVAFLSRSIKGLNGDYFDVYPMGNRKTMVTICEVAGRGVPAGLVMVMIRTILRLVATSDKDARTIMTLLHRAMPRRFAFENYASVVILVIDSEGSFSFSSAAHYPLQILRSATEGFEAIQTEGIPVGIDRKTQYHQQTGILNENDLVLIHTDGIPESRSRDGQAFGIDNLLNVVSSQAGNSPEMIIESIRTELEYFERGTDQKDDQTVIVFKYTGVSAA